MKNSISKYTSDPTYVWKDIVTTIQQLQPVFQNLENTCHTASNKFPFESLGLYRNKLSIKMSQTIVVSVLGGVKTGKSSIFQVLTKDTGAAVTGVEHLTHRPLAFSREVLDPPDLELAELFPEFDIKITKDSQDATKSDEPANRLWWMATEKAPPGVIFVDCPDLNSLNQVNRDLAFQLARSSDIIYLTMLGGASAYSADIKNFAQMALEMGRLIIPVFIRMDDEQSAQIVLDEFCREMTPLLNGQSPKFNIACFVPSVPVKHRSNLKKMQLQSLTERKSLILDTPSARTRMKAQIWYKSYHQFRTQLKEELKQIEYESRQWLAFWGAIKSALSAWATSVSAAIFPRSVVLREIIHWYEETRLNLMRKMLRRINPLNWPSRIYGVIRKQFFSEKERQMLGEQAQQALEKMRSQLDADANRAWLKIWGKESPQTTGELNQWWGNLQVNPIQFAGNCRDLVQKELMKPYLGQEWKKAFRRDLEVWWLSDDENSRQKRNFLEYSQLTLDFISWLALPTTIFLPGSLDTIIVSVAQPVLTFINDHFLFIESHFAGARQRWIDSEATRLTQALVAENPSLNQLVKKVRNWQQVKTSLSALDSTFKQIDEKISILLENAL